MNLAELNVFVVDVYCPHCEELVENPGNNSMDKPIKDVNRALWRVPEQVGMKVIVPKPRGG